MKSKIIYVLLFILFIAGFIVRLKDVSSPLADWHSWRQSDTAAVAREYTKNGIDLLHPQYQDISSLQSGRDNPRGYRMVEFPAVNALVAGIYTVFPVKQFPIHVVYRFASIIFSLISAWFIYLLIRRIESPFTGVLAAAAFLFIPYSIFYSRTTLPEIPMVAFCMIALWFGVRYQSTNSLIDAFGTAIASSIALLIKPVAVFILIPLVPIFVMKVIKGNKRNILIAVCCLLVAICPLIWWRWWIGHFPEGIPASSWLFNGNHIRFKGAFFYWLFADRLGRIILGYWGLILLGFGLLAKKKTNIVIWLLVGSLAYLVVFATGNVQHDYYQIPILPIVAILIAYGIQMLRHTKYSLIERYGLIVVSCLFMIMFGWYHVRSLFAINNPAIVAAGSEIDRIAAPNDLVIAPYQGDTAFLYQTNRRGWPIGGSIEEKISKGAKYYVTTTNDDETKQLAAKYQVIQQTSDFTIINLVPNN